MLKPICTGKYRSFQNFLFVNKPTVILKNQVLSHTFFLFLFSIKERKTRDLHFSTGTTIKITNFFYLFIQKTRKEVRFMKIICKAQNLVKGINTVTKAVPSRTTRTIQQCVLIDASYAGITLTANDLELGIETKVPGLMAEEGKIALDAKLFSEIIRKFPQDADVTLSSDEKNQTEIICETTNFNIMGKDGEEFSGIPYVEKNYKISISQYTLKEVIRQTIFSIAEVDTNKILTGELFEIRGGTLRVISLDGHRISIRSIALKDYYEKKEVIVPGKTLKEIFRILDGGTEEMVEIYIGENHILFEFSDTVVVSRLIEGNFFQVDQMLTNDYETKVTVNRQTLMDSLDRSILLINEGDNRPVIQSITASAMRLKIVSQMGKMEDSLDIEMEGKPIQIGFNPHFLLDALRAIDDETVTIYYLNSKAPCFIRDEEQSYIYLVLPVNFVEDEDFY